MLRSDAFSINRPYYLNYVLEIISNLVNKKYLVNRERMTKN